MLPRPLVTLLAACLLLLGCGSGPSYESRSLLADAEGGSHLLEPGESAAFQLELPLGGTLRLELGSTAAASLTLEARERDPMSAALVRSEPPLEIPLEPGREAARNVPLPATDRAYLEVELSWPAEAAAPVEIRGLTLVEPERPRPPIVFVSVDTLAARNMSLHGYGRTTTPELDAFAEECVVFEDCMANASWTTPSYISQFSGLHHRSFMDPEAERSSMEAWELRHLAEERWTLTEMLRAAGYRTAAFIDNTLAGAEFGLAQGFELFDDTAAGIKRHDGSDGIRFIVPRALAWLDELEPDEPFFLYVQVLDTHCPYRPPAPFDERFTDYETGAAVVPVETGFKSFDCIPKHVARGAHPKGELPEAMAPEPLVAAYDGEIAYVDDAFGELVDQLRARGILDQAIVIFSADHGESMLEHGYFFNHGTCYQENLHVPLVIHLPGGEGAGLRISSAVQLVDLYPTLAELVGIGSGRDELPGRSLLPLVRGVALPEVPRLAEGGPLDNSALVYDGWKLVEKIPGKGRESSFLTWRPVRELLRQRLPEVFPEGVPGPNEAREYVEASPQRRRIVNSLRKAFPDPVYELYDLEADPYELHDLSSSEPERLEQMKRLLERERMRVAELRAAGGWTGGSGFQPDAAQLEELRNLGYVGEDSGG